MPRSLQARVLAWVLAIVGSVWAASAVLTWRDARHELDELLDSHLAQAAALLVVQQVDEFEEDRRIDAPLLHRYAPKVAFQVFHEGRLALRSGNAPEQALMPPGASGFATVKVAGEPWRVFATQGAKGDVRVYVGEALGSRASILRAVLRGAVGPALAALPLLALGLWWAVRRGTAPMRAISATLAARTADDLHPIAQQDAPAEMQPLIDSLNGLLARIAQLLDTERRFTADAAHELRTPIAALRAQAEVALRESDDARRRHALDAVLEGCDRAVRVVEQLLTLSRLEAGQATLQTTDLTSVARQTVAEAAPAALRKHQHIAFDAEGPQPLRGNATLLAVLVRNLVDNAVRYSPEQARIEVRVAAQGGTVELTVEDSGPGLSDADLARLGERFFRVLGQDASGTGLGWSIVRRIAAAHGAVAQAGRSAALGGLRVRVSFPTA